MEKSSETFPLKIMQKNTVLDPNFVEKFGRIFKQSRTYKHIVDPDTGKHIIAKFASFKDKVYFIDMWGTKMYEQELPKEKQNEDLKPSDLFPIYDCVIKKPGKELNDEFKEKKINPFGGFGVSKKKKYDVFMTEMIVESGQKKEDVVQCYADFINKSLNIENDDLRRRMGFHKEYQNFLLIKINWMSKERFNKEFSKEEKIVNENGEEELTMAKILKNAKAPYLAYYEEKK